jgi:hypothetical protein
MIQNIVYRKFNKIISQFTKCSGIGQNIDKTVAIWIGSRKRFLDKSLPELIYPGTFRENLNS